MGKKIPNPNPKEVDVDIAPPVEGMEEEHIWIEMEGKKVPFYRQKINGETVYAEAPWRRTDKSMIIAPPAPGMEKYVLHINGGIPLFRQKFSGITVYSTSPEETERLRGR